MHSDKGNIARKKTINLNPQPMKNNLLIIAILACTAMGAQAQSTKKTAVDNDSLNMPVMLFEADPLDYGTIPYDSDGNREFKVKNIGKEPLIISKVNPICGCTIPLVPDAPIKSGETGIIKVHYDTKRVGVFNKGITVISNSTTPTKMIFIKGTVLPQKN